jgi:hypothetical protein
MRGVCPQNRADSQNQRLAGGRLLVESVVQTVSMTRFFMTFFSWFGVFFRSRNDLGLELIALRHQLAVLKRKNPRPRFNGWDRLCWLTLRRLWPK